MKDRDTAERTTVPFGEVPVEFGIHGVQKWPNEGYLPAWSHNAAFVSDIANCRDVSALHCFSLSGGLGIRTLIVDHEHEED
jgi:hypothetical protein